jgi:hypothetical protein
MARAAGHLTADVLLDSAPPHSALDIDMAAGPSAGFTGLRRVVGALTAAGATFGDLPQRYPGEWEHLAPGGAVSGKLEAIAIPASERRLHRESEYVFRVLSVAAAAICQGTQALGRIVLVSGAGRTDLPSLRGLFRTAEYQRASGIGLIRIRPEDALRTGPLRTGPADFRAERARCLRLLGLPVTSGDLRATAADDGGSLAPNAEGRLFGQALDPQGAAGDRIRAALEYGQAAFASGNWEGAAIVAAANLPVASQLSARDAAAVRDWVTADDNQSFELEPAILRSAADVRGQLLKVLGIQATFRELHDEAVGFFRAMRETDGPLAPELRAQSHLYAALTLTKRKHSIGSAVAELEAGFAALAGAADTPSVRRERGWLHNLRGLTHVREHDLAAAMREEKAALDCLSGLTDPSSVHLKVNLVSNVSVLQERRGRPEQALRTWERFTGSGLDADHKFVKHHQYRAGGLNVAIGNGDVGEGRLMRSLGACHALADEFHGYEISAELGTGLLRQRRSKRAAEHFQVAADAADRLGDPFRMAQARAGLALAAGCLPDDATAMLALRSLANPARAAALADAMRRGSADDVLAALPALRTKLNRPFDLVNF